MRELAESHRDTVQLMPETDGREGLRSLELLIAIYQAARGGRQVGLPLEY